MGSLSPKVLAPVVFLVVVCAALALLTGDQSYLIAVLLSLAGGGIGLAAPPAGGLTQVEVDALAERVEAEKLRRLRR